MAKGSESRPSNGETVLDHWWPVVIITGALKNGRGRWERTGSEAVAMQVEEGAATQAHAQGSCGTLGAGTWEGGDSACGWGSPSVSTGGSWFLSGWQSQGHL